MTVWIQRSEEFQPVGIWVFASLDAAMRIARDCWHEQDAMDFISSLEEMPVCPEAIDALNGGPDGHLGKCPDAWVH